MGLSVLDYARRQGIGSGLGDDELTLHLGQTHPEFLSADPDFAQRYTILTGPPPEDIASPASLRALGPDFVGPVPTPDEVDLGLAGLRDRQEREATEALLRYQTKLRQPFSVSGQLARLGGVVLPSALQAGYEEDIPRMTGGVGQFVADQIEADPTRLAASPRMPLKTGLALRLAPFLQGAQALGLPNFLREHADPLVQGTRLREEDGGVVVPGSEYDHRMQQIDADPMERFIGGAVRSIPPMIPIAAATAATGGLAGPAAAVTAGSVLEGAESLGQSYADNLEVLLNQGVPEAEARQRAGNTAKLTGLGTSAVGPLLNRLGIPTVTRRVADAFETVPASGLFKAAGGEAVEEAAQQVPAEVGERTWVDPNRPLSKSVENVAMAAAGGALLGTGVHAAGALLPSLDRGRSEAITTQAITDQVMAKAEASRQKAALAKSVADAKRVADEAVAAAAAITGQPPTPPSNDPSAAIIASSAAQDLAEAQRLAELAANPPPLVHPEETALLEQFGDGAVPLPALPSSAPAWTPPPVTDFILPGGTPVPPPRVKLRRGRRPVALLPEATPVAEPVPLNVPPDVHMEAPPIATPAEAPAVAEVIPPPAPVPVDVPVPVLPPPVAALPRATQLETGAAPESLVSTLGLAVRDSDESIAKVTRVLNMMEGIRDPKKLTPAIRTALKQLRDTGNLMGVSAEIRTRIEEITEIIRDPSQIDGAIESYRTFLANQAPATKDVAHPFLPVEEGTPFAALATELRKGMAASDKQAGTTDTRRYLFALDSSSGDYVALPVYLGKNVDGVRLMTRDPARHPKRIPGKTQGVTLESFLRENPHLVPAYTARMNRPSWTLNLPGRTDGAFTADEVASLSEETDARYRPSDPDTASEADLDEDETRSTFKTDRLLATQEATREAEAQVTGTGDPNEVLRETGNPVEDAPDAPSIAASEFIDRSRLAALVDAWIAQRVAEGEDPEALSALDWMQDPDNQELLRQLAQQYATEQKLKPIAIARAITAEVQAHLDDPVRGQGGPGQRAPQGARTPTPVKFKSTDPVQQLGELLATDLKPSTKTPAELARDTGLTPAFIAAFEKAFGIRIIPFAGTPGIQGAYWPGTPGLERVVFVSDSQGRAGVNIVAHELVHAIRQNEPALYAQMVAEVLPMLKDLPGWQAKLQQLAAYQGIDPDGANEELVADVVGRMFTDPEFLDALAERNPNLFFELANTVLDYLSRLLRNLRQAFATDQFGGDAVKHIADLEGLRTALADRLATFAERSQTALNATPKPPRPKFSATTPSDDDAFAGYTEMEVEEDATMPDIAADEGVKPPTSANSSNKTRELPDLLAKADVTQAPADGVGVQAAVKLLTELKAAGGTYDPATKDLILPSGTRMPAAEYVNHPVLAPILANMTAAAPPASAPPVSAGLGAGAAPPPVTPGPGTNAPAPISPPSGAPAPSVALAPLPTPAVAGNWQGPLAQDQIDPRYTREMFRSNDKERTFEDFSFPSADPAHPTVKQDLVRITTGDTTAADFGEKSQAAIAEWTINANDYVTGFDQAMDGWVRGVGPHPSFLGFDTPTYNGLKVTLARDIPRVLDPSITHRQTRLGMDGVMSWLMNRGWLTQADLLTQQMPGVIGNLTRFALARLRNTRLDLQAVMNSAQYWGRDLPELRSQALASHPDLHGDLERYQKELMNPAGHLGRQAISPLRTGLVLPSGHTVTAQDMEFFRRWIAYGREMLEVVQRHPDQRTMEMVDGRRLSRRAGSVGQFDFTRHFNDDADRLLDRLYSLYRPDPVKSLDPITDTTVLSASSKHPVVALWNAEEARHRALTQLVLDAARTDRSWTADQPLLTAMEEVGTDLEAGGHPALGSLDQVVSAVAAKLTTLPAGTDPVAYARNGIANILHQFGVKSVELQPPATTTGQSFTATVQSLSNRSEFSRPANRLELPSNYYDYGAASDFANFMKLQRAESGAGVEYIQSLKQSVADMEARLVSATAGDKTPLNGVPQWALEQQLSATRKFLKFFQAEPASHAGMLAQFLNRVTSGILSSPPVSINNATSGQLPLITLAAEIDTHGGILAMLRPIYKGAQSMASTTRNLVQGAAFSNPVSRAAFQFLETHTPSIYNSLFRQAVQWHLDTVDHRIEEVTNGLGVGKRLDPRALVRADQRKATESGTTLEAQKRSRNRLIRQWQKTVRTVDGIAGATARVAGPTATDSALNAGVLASLWDDVESAFKAAAEKYAPRVLAAGGLAPHDPRSLIQPGELSNRYFEAGKIHNTAVLRDKLLSAGIQMEAAMLDYWKRSQGGTVEVPFFTEEHEQSLKRVLLGDVNASTAGTNRPEYFRVSIEAGLGSRLLGYSADQIPKQLAKFLRRAGGNSSLKHAFILALGAAVVMLLGSAASSVLQGSLRESYYRHIRRRPSGRFSPLDSEFWTSEGADARMLGLLVANIPGLGDMALTLLNQQQGSKGFAPTERFLPVSVLKAVTDSFLELKTLPAEDKHMALDGIAQRFMPLYGAGRDALGFNARGQWNAGVSSMSEGLKAAGVQSESGPSGSQGFAVGPTTGMRRKLQAALMQAEQARTAGDAAGVEKATAEATHQRDRLLQHYQDKGQDEKQAQSSVRRDYSALDPARRANNNKSPTQVEIAQGYATLSPTQKAAYDQTVRAWQGGSNLFPDSKGEAAVPQPGLSEKAAASRTAKANRSGGSAAAAPAIQGGGGAPDLSVGAIPSASVRVSRGPRGTSVRLRRSSSRPRRGRVTRVKSVRLRRGRRPSVRRTGRVRLRRRPA